MVRSINIEELYGHYYTRLLHQSYSITKDYQLAEDVVQETFIKVMKNINTIQSEEELAAWLSVIAKRTAIDIVRSERKKSAIPMEQDMLVNLGKESKQHVEKEVEITYLIEQLNTSINSLNTVYQDVMVLKVKEDLKEREIAEQLNVPLASVKSRIHRARKYLVAVFQDKNSA